MGSFYFYLLCFFFLIHFFYVSPAPLQLQSAANNDFLNATKKEKKIKIKQTKRKTTRLIINASLLCMFLKYTRYRCVYFVSRQLPRPRRRGSHAVPAGTAGNWAARVHFLSGPCYNISKRIMLGFISSGIFIRKIDM